MQVVQTLLALPGQCFLCGSADRKEFIDTERQLEFHGAVYICDECVAIMTQMLRYPTPEAYRRAIRDADTMGQRVLEMTIRINRAKEALNGVRLPDHPAVDNGSVVAPLDEGHDEESPSTDRVDEPAAPGGEVGLDSREGSPPEPDDDEGVGELRQPPEPSDGGFKLSL